VRHRGGKNYKLCDGMTTNNQAQGRPGLVVTWTITQSVTTECNIAKYCRF